MPDTPISFEIFDAVDGRERLAHILAIPRLKASKVKKIFFMSRAK